MATRLVYHSDEIMGPGFFIFFNKVATVGGGGSSPSPKEKKDRDDELFDLGLDDDDLIDILALTAKTGILDE
jgi:hypothetical protein